ncbi:hypothetical protein CUMW_270140 [Citrus unshiu]|uniref:Uncharacterized protein n=1 Tax=Citrus unshiu TaxID=55188 RepID=A0A2H5QY27_CITUN|nr:hypothetical protein CUMW_270140 [Citrus unshiu]
MVWCHSADGCFKAIMQLVHQFMRPDGHRLSVNGDLFDRSFDIAAATTKLLLSDLASTVKSVLSNYIRPISDRPNLTEV